MSHLWLMNDDDIATGCTYKEFQEGHDNFAKLEFIASSERKKGWGTILMKKVLDHLNRMRLMEVYVWAIFESGKYYRDNGFNEIELDSLSEDLKTKLGKEPGCALMHKRLPDYQKNRYDLMDPPFMVSNTTRAACHAILQ